MRNLALYVPVVLSTYLLACASVETLTRAKPPPFLAIIVECSAYGWLAPLLFAPAALVLLVLAARMPSRWPPAPRRLMLLATAPLLFAGSMGAATLAIAGNTNILTWPYVALVVVPALAYAAVVHLPVRFE